MNIFTVPVPALYGDHHVIEVRRVLLELPGVEAVYASSSFHVVEITYDPARIDEGTITACLGEAGYLDSLDLPHESENAAPQADREATSFRHTTSYAQTRQVIGFGHLVAYSGRALWPCPGMGTVERVDKGE